MSRRWLKRLLIAAFIVALLPLVYDRSLGILGVGSTHLTIQFIVIDADDGTPIKDAHIYILTETQWERIIAIDTNDEGVGSILFPDTTSTCRESGLRLTYSRTVDFRVGLYTVEADGYALSDWTRFDRKTPVQWTDPDGATIVVTVPLHRE